MIRLKVLIVDDSAADAERTVAELCRGGYTPTWERVCNREETESALSGDGFDLVLSDYRMEGFGALEALSLAKDHDPDLPFVIFSEELGEETAVRAIKAGAHNWVDKNSVGRLCPAVERELRDAQVRRERRLARKALRESENRFRALAETASDAILTVGEDGRILYVNRAAEPIFRHPAASLIGEPLSILLPGHAYAGPNAPAVWMATSTGQAVAVTGRRADGSDIPLEISFGEWVRDGRRLLTVIARDASVLRSAEQSLRESESRLRQLFERNLAGLYRFTLDGRMLDCNPAFARIFGYESREEVLAVHAVEFYLSPSDRMEFLRRLSERRSLSNYEQRLRRRDGRVVWVLENESLVDGTEPGTQIIEGTLVDITERKRAEEEREASFSLVRATLEATADGLLVVDRQGFIVTFNQRLVDMWRFPDDAIEARDHSVAMQSVAHTLEDPSAVLDKIESVDAAPESESHDVVRFLDGRVFERSSRPQRVGGISVGRVWSFRDVTDTLRTEEALRGSEKRYRTLFERNLAGVYRTTLDGRVLDCNDAFARIFGYSSREEVIGRPAEDFYPSPEAHEAAMDRLRERQLLANHEECLRRRDGSLVWILQNGHVIEGADGAPGMVEGTIIDITDRKRAEEQVKHLAFHDALTGLPNRLLFQDRLNMAVLSAHRSGQRLAILFLDLDRFKVINDSLGHSVGDELLRQVSARLGGSVREGDTVARLGGDEFTVLAAGIGGTKTRRRSDRRSCRRSACRFTSTATSSSSPPRWASPSTRRTARTRRRSSATRTRRCTGRRSRDATTASSTRRR